MSKSQSAPTMTRAQKRGAAWLGRVLDGRYRLDRVLGSGGLAVVFEGTQIDLDRSVAIKIMRRDRQDPKLLARLRREARTIADIAHPNVVELYDIGTTPEGEAYLVMELVRGETLTALIAREGPLDERRAHRIAEQVLGALAEVHRHGLVHRDLKPGNLMVGQTATGADHVTLLDFGIVKTDDSDAVQLTQTGCIVGSPQYIAPEQVTGGEVTPRTDLYTFGCVVHEMLTGQRLFPATTPVDAVLAHLHTAPPPPAVGGVSLSGALVDLAMLCLQKMPAHRPPTARSCLRLLRWRASPHTAASPPRRRRCVMAPAEARHPISVVVPPTPPSRARVRAALADPQDATETARFLVRPRRPAPRRIAPHRLEVSATMVAYAASAVVAVTILLTTV